jgi:hypothetical protein
MKYWTISILISCVVWALVIVGMADFVAQDACLDSGGSWQGFSEGCTGGDTYSYFVVTPVSIVLLFSLVLGLSWLITLLLRKLWTKT